jgi:hypothetical protein
MWLLVLNFRLDGALAEGCGVKILAGAIDLLSGNPVQILFSRSGAG